MRSRIMIMIMIAAGLVLAAPLPAAAQNTVLVDVSNGYVAGGGPEFFTEMKATFNAWGYRWEVNDQSLTEISLSDVAIVLITTSWVHDEAYTNFERDVLADFVDDGGCLLVLSDHPLMENANLNIVTQEFGITCGVDWMNDYVVVAGAHPVINGLGDVELSTGGLLSVSGGAEVIGVNALGQTLIAGRDGSGKVLVIGDICMSTFNWDPAMEALLIKILHWFRNIPVPDDGASWGGVKTLFR